MNGPVKISSRVFDETLSVFDSIKDLASKLLLETENQQMFTILFIAKEMADKLSNSAVGSNDGEN